MTTHGALEATDATIDQVLAGNETVLVDFSAEWCPPCKAMAPSIEKLAAEFTGRAAVVTIDVDRNPATAERFGITAMPTLLVFRNGKVADQAVGARSLGALRDLLQRHLPAVN